jgi:hypothetical protein
VSFMLSMLHASLSFGQGITSPAVARYGWLALVAFIAYAAVGWVGLVRVRWAGAAAEHRPPLGRLCHERGSLFHWNPGAGEEPLRRPRRTFFTRSVS